MGDICYDHAMQLTKSYPPPQREFQSKAITVQAARIVRFKRLSEAACLVLTVEAACRRASAFELNPIGDRTRRAKLKALASYSGDGSDGST